MLGAQGRFVEPVGNFREVAPQPLALLDERGAAFVTVERRGERGGIGDPEPQSGVGQRSRQKFAPREQAAPDAGPLGHRLPQALARILCAARLGEIRREPGQRFRRTSPRQRRRGGPDHGGDAGGERGDVLLDALDAAGLARHRLARQRDGSPDFERGLGFLDRGLAGEPDAGHRGGPSRRVGLQRAGFPPHGGLGLDGIVLGALPRDLDLARAHPGGLQ